MSTPSSRDSRFVSRFTPHVWWILLIAALALLWLATERRIDRVEAITNLPTWSTDAPPRDADSPTGYEESQRHLIIPGHHNPSFWWIMEAQKAAEEGKLRLRHIDYDAAPDGREIRRTAPYRWWLIACGWLHGALHEEPIGYAIERGALIADPLLLALLLIVGTAYTARYLGSFAAIGFVVGGISLFPLAANFQPGAPDPHSLAWVLAVGSILPLLASPRKLRGRRRTHFAVAGIFGGIGFWNDATSQAPVLLAVAIGGLCYEFMRSRGELQPPASPSAWRAWGLAGALTVLTASVFEFAPNHFAWSLDSAHPIHALAWWGAGEALHAAGLWFREGRRGFNRRSVILVGAAVVAVSSWPVVGAFSDSGSLLATDFYAREIANHPSGGVASSLKVWLDRADTGAKWATFLPSLLIGFVLFRICMGKIDWETRGRLSIALVAASFAVVMALFQLRWWNLFDALALLLMAGLFAEAEAATVRARAVAFGATLLALPGLFVGFPSSIEGQEPPELSPLEKQALIERDFSYWLNKRSGTEPIVLFSTPLFSSGAAYYGGFQVVVSSDDGNKDGQQAAVRIASADSAQEVSILLNSRGITHVALPLWDPMLEQLVRAGMAVPAGEPLPDAAFVIALRDWDVPPWMRPMNYSIPQEQGFKGFDLSFFALQAEQATELALSRLADLFVERGQLWEAKSIRGALRHYPRSIEALGAIANIDYALRDQQQLEESLEAVIPYLSRRSARNLPVDRRVSLAALLLRTQHADLAREQVRAALDDLDSQTLRALTPGSVAGLVALSRALDIPFPKEELDALAMELVPPDIRAHLPKR